MGRASKGQEKMNPQAAHADLDHAKKVFAGNPDDPKLWAAVKNATDALARVTLAAELAAARDASERDAAKRDAQSTLRARFAALYAEAGSAPVVEACTGFLERLAALLAEAPDLLPVAAARADALAQMSALVSSIDDPQGERAAEIQLCGTQSTGAIAKVLVHRKIQNVPGAFAWLGQ